MGNQAFKIQSKIRRAAGSTVTLDNETYVFNNANDHTAVVEDPLHIERLLSITEGFRLVGAVADGEVVSTPQPKQPPAGDEPPKAARKPRTPKAAKEEKPDANTAADVTPPAGDEPPKE